MILQRYIASHLVRGWIMVFLVLATVFGLIGFIEEIGHTRFEYDAIEVARYILKTLPQQLIGLAPVIVLLGSMVALSGLDRSNELTIISCTGFPLRKLLGAVALPTLVLMALLWGAMEYVAPQLQQSAERERHLLRYRNDAKIPNGGLWSATGHRYIHLDKLYKGGIPGDISLYEFDESRQLTRALTARTAQVSPERRWLFEKVREKRLVDGELITGWHQELEIDNLWAADELPTLSTSSEGMPLSVMHRYSQYLRDSGQPADRYLNQFWQHLLMPLTVAAMVLLATPLSANLGARRDRSFGMRIGLGAVLGILFYLGAQITFAMGQLLHLNIPLVAAAPALIVTLCALVLLRRMRW